MVDMTPNQKDVLRGRGNDLKNGFTYWKGKFDSPNPENQFNPWCVKGREMLWGI
jgi:hypothetical protein